MKTLKRLYHTFRYLYNLIHWEDCEPLTFYERYYLRRIGPGTAWTLAGMIVN